MTEEQQAALAGVAGTSLGDELLAELEPLVEARNDVAIAELLSAGRTRHAPTQIGIGTVIAAMGDPRGGQFLDAVEDLGKTDRTVYWGFDPVRRGVLDLAVPAGLAMMVQLRAKMPAFADDIDKLLAVGVVADPINFNTVSDALNRATPGVMTL